MVKYQINYYQEILLRNYCSYLSKCSITALIIVHSYKQIFFLTKSLIITNRSFLQLNQCKRKKMLEKKKIGTDLFAAVLLIAKTVNVVFGNQQHNNWVHLRRLYLKNVRK